LSPALSLKIRLQRELFFDKETPDQVKAKLKENWTNITDGFSGADTSAVANTAVSLVLHEYLAKYPTPEEAAKNASEAHVMMRHFEEAVRKIKTQREREK
jgi:SpoVK/Ycf46/Vps4 family AAA+-type ATPase